MKSKYYEDMPPGLRDKLEEHKVEGRTVFIITQNKLLSGSGLMYPKLIPALLSFVRKYSYILPNPLEIKLNFDDENYYARARDGDLLIIDVLPNPKGWGFPPLENLAW